MNLKGADLNLLVALEALLTEKSVTKAAERLHITQPAMSNALRRIRERFGDEILVRNGRQLELTPAAQTLLAPVQEILSDAEALLNVNRTFDPATARKTYYFMMSDYCADVLMPGLAGYLTQHAPRVRCEVEFLSNQALERLSSGELDMCIMPHDLRLLTADTKIDRFLRQEVFRDDFVCVVSSGNPLTQHELTLDTYVNSPHVCVKFGDGTISMDDQAKRQLGIESTFMVPAAGTLTKIIASTNLIATIPHRLVSGAARDNSITLYPCPIEVPDVVEVMLWHPRCAHDPSHAWMRNAIADAARLLPPLSRL